MCVCVCFHRRIDRARRRILYVQSLIEQCRIWLYVQSFFEQALLHRRLLYEQSLFVVVVVNVVWARAGFIAGARGKPLLHREAKGRAAECRSTLARTTSAR